MQMHQAPSHHSGRRAILRLDHLADAVELRRRGVSLAGVVAYLATRQIRVSARTVSRALAKLAADTKHESGAL